MNEYAVIMSAVAAAVAAISGIILGWLGHAKSVKKEIQSETATTTSMKSDMEYIKRGVDDLRLEQKDQGRRFDAMAERLARVEESAKQAHHRISRLEGRNE